MDPYWIRDGSYINDTSRSYARSKPDLADKFMAQRIEEIRMERNSDGWKPKLPY